MKFNVVNFAACFVSLWLMPASTLPGQDAPLDMGHSLNRNDETIKHEHNTTQKIELWQLDTSSTETLLLPELSTGEPAAGKKVAVTPSEYNGTNVFHTVYLPPDWTAKRPPLPIIFEYTGNYFPTSGSTGKVEDAGLGFGLSGGKYIWVSLPFINQASNENEVTWWGDESATIAYAKQNVPGIIEEFNADPGMVFLCGFSRGSIGVNYIGLHDNEISKLWSVFITHDHFDGVKEWRGTNWGSPLEKYQAKAAERLNRIGKRPYLVSQNGNSTATLEFIKSSLASSDTYSESSEPLASNFTSLPINTREILGEFPNEFAKHPHTDRWLLKPSKYRTATWEWMNRASRSEK